MAITPHNSGFGMPSTCITTVVAMPIRAKTSGHTRSLIALIAALGLLGGFAFTREPAVAVPDDEYAPTPCVSNLRKAQWHLDRWESASILQVRGIPASSVEDLADLLGTDEAMKASYQEVPLPSGVTKVPLSLLDQLEILTQIWRVDRQVGFVLLMEEFDLVIHVPCALVAWRSC